MLRYYSYYSVGGYKDLLLGDSNSHDEATYYLPMLPVLEERGKTDAESRQRAEELQKLPAIKQLTIDNSYDLPSSARYLFSHAGYKLLYRHLEGDKYAIALRDIYPTAKDETGRPIPFLIVIMGDSPADLRTLDTLAAYMANNIATTERAMHGDWHIQYENRTTPKAATELLRLFHEKKLPGPATYPLLYAAMKNAMLSPERLRSGLPAGTSLIHKTGTSLAFYQKQGMTLNDIGIIILPDGKPVYISVFVYRCKEPRARAEKMIAAIARTAWEHFTTPPVPDHTPDVPPAAMTVHQPSAPANGTTSLPPDTPHRPGETPPRPAP